MMATQGQLTAMLKLDSSQFTSGMTEVSNQINQASRLVVVQDESWKRFSATVIESAARIVSPILNLVAWNKRLEIATVQLAIAQTSAVAPTLALGAATNFLLSPIVLTLAAIAALAGIVYFLTGAFSNAHGQIRETSKAAQDAHKEMASLPSSATSFLAGLVGTSGLDALVELKDSIAEVRSAAGSLQDALLQPFRDVGFEVGSLIDLLVGFTAKVNMASESLKGIASFLGTAKDTVKSGIAQATLTATMLATGLNEQDAKELIAAHEKVREAAIQAFQAQQAEAFATKELKQLLDDATKASERKSEIDRIGHIFTLQGLQDESDALQQQIADMQRRGEYTKEARKDAAELANAIAKQQQGLINKTIIDREAEAAHKRARDDFKKTEDAIRSAQNAADRLQFGHVAAELQKFQDNNPKASQGQIQRMREELELQEKLQQQEKDRRAAEGLKDSLRSPLDKLKDQLAEIRKFEQAGLFTTDEAAKLRQQAAENFTGKPSDESHSSGKLLSEALQFGSKEAASALVRAATGSNKNPNKRLEDYAQKQLEATKALAEDREERVANF